MQENLGLGVTQHYTPTTQSNHSKRELAYPLTVFKKSTKIPKKTNKQTIIWNLKSSLGLEPKGLHPLNKRTIKILRALPLAQQKHQEVIQLPQEPDRPICQHESKWDPWSCQPQ